MNQQRDIERLLDHWFSDGPTEAPDRVIDRIADRIERQSQRHAWRLQRRPYPMNTYAKIAVAAAAVLIVALVGYNLLPANNKGIGGPNPPPTAQADRDASTNPSRDAVDRARTPAAVHLKVATIESDTSPAAQALATFADEVTRSTGGQIVVDIKTAGCFGRQFQGRAHPGDEAQEWRLRSRPGPDAGLGRRGCHVIPRNDGSVPHRQ